MQAVILAAGRGTRMGVLTEALPKPLLEVGGRTLLEHAFAALPDEVEVMMVVGYLGNLIQERFGDFHEGKKIEYIEQPNYIGGTADALWQARHMLSGDFIVMYADDIRVKADVAHCLGKGWVMCVMPLPELGSAADVLTDEKGSITDIVEASAHKGGPGLANTGLYVLDPRIFDVSPIHIAERAELGLPQTMLKASRQLGIPITTIEATAWLTVSTPQELEQANRFLGGK